MQNTTTQNAAKAVIFDLDGTLLDTVRDIRAFINVAMEKFGYPTLDKQSIVSFIGNGSRNLVMRCMGKETIDEHVEEVHKYYNDVYASSVSRLTVPFDGINELLLELKARGYKLIIITNKPQRNTDDLVKVFFKDIGFDAVIGQRNDVKCKPDKTATLAFIVNIANGIEGVSREEIVDKIFRYVQGTLKYTVIQNIGAKKALEIKKGKCSEYAASMVALCRAKGIPARIVTGHFLRERDTSHAWVEVYYDEYGWVTYDPTILSSTIVYKDAKGRVLKVVNNLKPDEAQSNYIVLSRNELSRSPINYTFAPDSKGSAQITTQFSVEKM